MPLADNTRSDTEHQDEGLTPEEAELFLKAWDEYIKPSALPSDVTRPAVFSRTNEYNPISNYPPARP